MTPIQTAILARVAKAMGFPYAIVASADPHNTARCYADGPSAACVTIALSWSRDSAAQCLKTGWEWQRRYAPFSADHAIEWIAHIWKDGKCIGRVSTPDTGDEIADRYTLAALTWEAEMSYVNHDGTPCVVSTPDWPRTDTHPPLPTASPTDYELIVGLWRDHPECLPGMTWDGFSMRVREFNTLDWIALPYARDAMRTWIREQGYDFTEYSNGHLIADQRYGTHVASTNYGTPTARLVRLCRYIKERTTP